MARRAAHSTEELKDIIRDYLDTNVSFHKLTASELARYCKTKLNISDITYQSFSRNKEVN